MFIDVHWCSLFFFFFYLYSGSTIVIFPVWHVEPGLLELQEGGLPPRRWRGHHRSFSTSRSVVLSCVAEIWCLFQFTLFISGFLFPRIARICNDRVSNVQCIQFCHFQPLIADFDAAWAIMNPNTPAPTRDAGDLLYKVAGLPFGCSLKMMEAWLANVAWNAKPLKAIGAQAWLVRAVDRPPLGHLLFNSSPVLLTFLLPKQEPSRPILAGPPPRPKVQGPKGPGASAEWPQGDPWQNWQGTTNVPSASTTVRQTEGPTTLRLQAQDAKIEALQLQVTKLNDQQSQMETGLTSRMTAIETQGAEHHKFVEKSLQSLRGDMDQALQQSLTKTAQLMDSKFEDLKALFGARANKRPSEEGAPMDTNWLLREGSSGPLPLMHFNSIPLAAGRLPRFTLILEAIGLVFGLLCLGFHTRFSWVTQPMSWLFGFWWLWIPMCFVVPLANQYLVGTAILLHCLSYRQILMSCPRFSRRLLQWALIMLTLLPRCAASPVIVTGVHDGFAHCLRMPLASCRIGEANNPGPPGDCHRFALVNPTTIGPKAAIFQELHAQFEIGSFIVSETAATPITQACFARQIKPLKSSWSAPCEEHKARADMLPSTRGKAGGVALISQAPVRVAVGTLSKDLELTTRIQHHVLALPGMQIQVVTIYGQTANHTDSKDFNNGLLQAAIDATRHLPLPTLIAGDFNCDATLLPSYDVLRFQGFVDLRALHERHHGVAMPPTCKEATWPDQAILSPDLVARYRGSQVLSDWHFDAHKVVCFDVAMHNIPAELLWGLPKSWTDLPVEPDFLEPAYAQLCSERGSPQTLEEWGQTVESSVDLAYRWSQMSHSGVALQATRGLPRAFRGRCQRRTPKQRRPVSVLKRARAGDFNPDIEIVKPLHVKQVRQLRRIQALVRRLKKYHDDIPAAQVQSLQREWDAILRSDAFGANFVHWCCQMPELGPPVQSIPSLDYAFSMQQLLQHEVQITLAAVQKHQILHKQYMQNTDAKLQGSSKAFAVMRDSFSAPLSQIQVTVEDAGVSVSEGSACRIYCEKASQLRSDAILQVQGHPALVQDHDNYCTHFWLDFMPCQLTCHMKWPCPNNKLHSLHLNFSRSFEITGKNSGGCQMYLLPDFQNLMHFCRAYPMCVKICRSIWMTWLDGNRLSVRWRVNHVGALMLFQLLNLSNCPLLRWRT